MDCFTRDENNGLHIIMPLGGPMKLDCMVVNDGVRAVHEILQQELSLEDVCAAYIEWADRQDAESLIAEPTAGSDTVSLTSAESPRRGPTHPEPRPPSKQDKRFDLYRILLMFKDHEICNYDDTELLSLLPPGKELKGSSQIMSVGAAQKTSDFLKDSLAAGPIRPFYSQPNYERLDRSYFDLGPLARRHLTQEQVHFIKLDAKGAVESCMVVGGLLLQPQTLRISYVAGRHDSDEGFEEAVGSHMASVCGMLSVVTLSAAIRFEYTVGDGSDVYLHDQFVDLLGDLGFRRAYVIPDELEVNKGVVGYDKALY